MCGVLDERTEAGLDMTPEGSRGLADAPDGLEDLPASAKLVAVILQGSGWLRREEIASRALLPVSTVSEALRRLDEAGVLESRPGWGDARGRAYRLHVEPEGEGFSSESHSNP